MRNSITSHVRRAAAAAMTLGAVGGLIAGCIGKPVQVCPTPLVLKKASDLVRFAPGTTISDESLDFRASMKLKSMQCEYVDDLLTELEVNMELDITAVRGPANHTGEAELEYFVAITDVRGTILSKEVFPIDMELGNVGFPVTETEGIWQQYQFLKGQTGQAYRVWVGFQLNEQELETARRLKEQ